MLVNTIILINTIWNFSKL